MPDWLEFEEELEKLPHYKNFQCTRCGKELKAHTLETYKLCSRCFCEHKLRSFSGGLEIQDVIEKVAKWLAEDDQVTELLKQYRKS